MGNLRKPVAAVLAVCLAAGILSGCGDAGAPANAPESTGPASAGAVAEQNFNETGMPVVKEKLVQKMAFVSDQVYTTDLGPELYFFKEMEKKTNINFEFEKLTPDQWTERKNLMFASNELPDIMVGSLTNSDIITYSKAGQLLALNDLLEQYAPDYLGRLSGFKESAKLYAPDGQMYGMVNTFTGGSAETPGARAFINKKWIDTLGMEMPATYQELYDVLVAFRDRDPDGNGQNDTIPLSGYNKGYSVDAFVAGPLGMSFSGSGKDQWQIVDGRMTLAVEHPNYRQYLENMQKLYAEKLLDQEYFTQNDAQMKAKGENLQIGAYVYAAHFVLTGSTDPAIYDQYVVPEPFTSDKQTEKVWYGEAVGSPYIFLTSANKNPEATIRYFNEIYTEAGAELLVGPEKGAWDGEGGRVWNEEHTSFTYDIPEGYNGEWDWICKQIAPVQSFQGYMQFSDIKAKEQKAPEDASFKDAMEKNVAPYLKPGAPSLFFTPEELEEIKLVETSLYTYSEQMEAKIIMGEEPLDAYDTMLAELKKQGLDKVTEVYNAAYDRYKANQK